jgi:hypothetical protein
MGAVPTRAVSTRDGPVLWLAGGTPVKWPGVSGRPVREVPLEDRYLKPRTTIHGPWRGDGVLILGQLGRAHSIWLFWENWRFKGWYVQLEEPWRPSGFGFDTADHALDIWVASDGSWRWKDEHELDVGLELGFFSGVVSSRRRAGHRGVGVSDRMGGLERRSGVASSSRSARMGGVTRPVNSPGRTGRELRVSARRRGASHDRSALTTRRWTHARPAADRRWHTGAMGDVAVIVAAVAVLAFLGVLLVTAFLGFRELRRFLRGQH